MDDDEAERDRSNDDEDAAKPIAESMSWALCVGRDDMAVAIVSDDAVR